MVTLIFFLLLNLLLFISHFMLLQHLDEGVRLELRERDDFPSDVEDGEGGAVHPEDVEEGQNVDRRRLEAF